MGVGDMGEVSMASRLRKQCTGAGPMSDAMRPVRAMGRGEGWRGENRLIHIRWRRRKRMNEREKQIIEHFV